MPPVLPIITSLIDSAGIEFYVQGEEALSLIPVGGAGSAVGRASLGAIVHVHAEDAPSVRALLEEIRGELPRPGGSRRVRPRSTRLASIPSRRKRRLGPIPAPTLPGTRPMSYPAEGGCLCGAVRYRLVGPPLASRHCHCENCRRASGAGVLTWITVRQADFEWLQDEPKRYAYSSPHYPAAVERWFCATCGSQLGWHCEDDGTVDLTAGSLDDPSLAEPSRHVFTHGQVPWIDFRDDLPRFKTRPTAEGDS